MNLNQSGIYQIFNTANGKCYVGSAVNIQTRWYKHTHRLRRGTHHSPILQNAWAKYGPAAFELRALLFCAQEELLSHEQRFIDELQPEYNVCPVAGRTTGMKHSPEALAKMSTSQQNSPSKGLSFKGRSHTDATKQKMSDAAKRRTPTERQLESLTVGRRLPRTAMQLARMVGNTLAVGYKHTPEAIVKITEKSRNPSDETRALLSAAATRRWDKYRLEKGITDAS